MAQQVELSTSRSNPAKAYEAHFVPAMFGPWAAELIQRVEPRPGERALDVACGTGAVTRQIAPLVGATGTVVGLDLSPGMLAVARALPAPAGAGISWREGQAEDLPFPDASFDVVCCQQGVQFSSDRPAVLREMRRVLGPGGRAEISVWRGIDQQSVFATLDEVIGRHSGIEPDNTPFSFGDPDELRSLLAGAGFHHISIETVVRTVRFASAAEFVRLTFLAATAVMPDEITLDGAAREELLETISRELEEPLRAYRDGAGLTFPTTANVALAE